MIAHPTHILRTTRGGSRSAVQRLNQSLHVRKGEPSRRNVRACTCVRIGEPDTKSADTRAAVTDASLLLVILHYLLKNNTQFIGWNVQVKVSPRVPSPTISDGGATE